MADSAEATAEELANRFHARCCQHRPHHETESCPYREDWLHVAASFLAEVWVAIDFENGYEFARYYGPFASCDEAKAYCQQQEWDEWGAQRVTKP
jgi:hypothetical protein